MNINKIIGFITLLAFLALQTGLAANKNQELTTLKSLLTQPTINTKQINKIADIIKTSNDDEVTLAAVEALLHKKPANDSAHQAITELLLGIATTSQAISILGTLAENSPSPLILAAIAKNPNAIPPKGSFAYNYNNPLKSVIANNNTPPETLDFIIRQVPAIEIKLASGVVFNRNTSTNTLKFIADTYPDFWERGLIWIAINKNIDIATTQNIAENMAIRFATGLSPKDSSNWEYWRQFTGFSGSMYTSNWKHWRQYTRETINEDAIKLHIFELRLLAEKIDLNLYQFDALIENARTISFFMNHPQLVALIKKNTSTNGIYSGDWNFADLLSKNPQLITAINNGEFKLKSTDFTGSNDIMQFHRLLYYKLVNDGYFTLNQALKCAASDMHMSALSRDSQRELIKKGIITPAKFLALSSKHLMALIYDEHQVVEKLLTGELLIADFLDPDYFAKQEAITAAALAYSDCQQQETTG